MIICKAFITAAFIVVTGSSFALAGGQNLSRQMGIVSAPLPKQIVAQGQTIYIKARAGQPTRFTVRAKDRKVLAKNLTLDELQRKDPALAGFVRRSLTVFRTHAQNFTSLAAK